MQTYTITLIRGDGIGPEIAESVLEVFAAAEAPIRWEEAEAGLACLERHGTPIPEATLESIRRNRVALKGPTTTPVGGGHRSINVAIRKAFELFANVRPARSIPGVQTRYNDIDLILVRENIEDTYAGVEYWQTPDVAESLRLISRPGSAAVIRYAFDLARRLGRRKVTCVHKANIQKLSDGLFLECFRAIAAEYHDIESDDILVDNACMQLVMRPERFDVLVLPNLFGDIVSDLCAGLIGGLGVAPGGNIGNGYAVFEAVHGSAPDIAGKGIANPDGVFALGGADAAPSGAARRRRAHRERPALHARVGHQDARLGRQREHARVHQSHHQQPAPTKPSAGAKRACAGAVPHTHATPAQHRRRRVADRWGGPVFPRARAAD